MVATDITNQNSLTFTDKKTISLTKYKMSDLAAASGVNLQPSIPLVH